MAISVYRQYRQRHFYMVDISNIFSSNIVMTQMLLPLIFTLQAENLPIRQVQCESGLIVEIRSGDYGCATIHDADLWIYCISLLIENFKAIRKGRFTQTVCFTAYDFLQSTSQRTGGDRYQHLIGVLHRLEEALISIHHTVKGNNRSISLKLIESWQIIRDESNGQRMRALEVTLPDWIVNAIKAKREFSINGEYFMLRKPLERYLYIVACQYCNIQSRFSFPLAKLHATGSSKSNLREFRRSIKTITTLNRLPDYQIRYYEDTDSVSFYNRMGIRGYKTHIRDLIHQLNEHRKDYIYFK